MVVGYNRSHTLEEEIGPGLFYVLFLLLIENIKEEELIEFPFLNL